MLLIGLSGCGDSAAPGPSPVASVAILSGDLQRGPAGAELPSPLVVRVLDAERDPVSGQVVNFHVVAGGGSVFAGSGSSNSDGLVQERWTLGPVHADTQRVEARAVDPATGEPIVFAVFRALATPAAGGRLLLVTPIVEGRPEIVIGQTTDWPIRMVAYDGLGSTVAGLEISFAVTGGGTISQATAVTDNIGRVEIEPWTMGPTPGLNTLTVSAPGYLSATIEAIAITRASLKIIPAASDLAVDSMVRLVLAQLDAAGDTVLDPSAQFRSLDPAVATVSAGGVVAGVATGQTGIVAQSGELADTAAVTVAMGFTAVSAGSGTTCAIRVGGEARCWGSDEHGQLGDGPGNSTGTVPVPVAGGLRFAQVGTSSNPGERFSCGLTAAGSAYCWGDASVGQLGKSGPSSDAPQPVSGGLAFGMLSVGGTHACALTTTGKAYCWGGNADGQLGTGDSALRSQPTAVAGNLTFTTLSAGLVHTCGVTAGGAAHCWGSGEWGRLGQGTTDGSPTPVPVAGGLTFASVSAGPYHSCGVTIAGAAYCWGFNGGGRIGLGHYAGLFTGVLVPALVAGGKSWIAISAGNFISCGLTDDGSAYCWGQSHEGNMGNGSWDTGNPHPSPELVAGSHHFSSISVGSQACAVSTGPGTPLYCWGTRPGLVTGF